MKPIAYKLKIISQDKGPGIISFREELVYPGMSDTESHVMKLTEFHMDTKEQIVREALIKLGWTPPEGK